MDSKQYEKVILPEAESDIIEILDYSGQYTYSFLSFRSDNEFTGGGGACPV